MFLGSWDQENNTNVGVDGRCAKEDRKYTLCYMHDYNEHFSRCNC